MSRNRAQQKRSGQPIPWFLVQTCCLTAALIFVRCAPQTAISGTGSQAGNGTVLCSIYNSDGSPASGATVLLRRGDYTADTAGASLGKRASLRRDTRTDQHGAFVIDSVDTGVYCIEVNDGKGQAVVSACTVGEGMSVINLPADTLRPTDSIVGIFSSTPGATVALYVQIYGLERIGVRNTATGGFAIRDVPRGKYSLRVAASLPDFRPINIQDIVVADTTTDIGAIDFIHLSHWQYAKRIRLNTSQTGANVANKVVNFPVLLRLRPEVFDFSQASANGSDVRFTTLNGVPLPYEIERWDPVAKQAEVWVNVDTVFANDSAQSITMYWGNTQADGLSSGPMVFDTVNGFQGIWHLGNSDSVATDATGNHYAGTGMFIAPITGIIGLGQHFNGASSVIRIKRTALKNNVSYSVNGRYTLSAWVRHDTLADSVTYMIAGKGELQYFLKTFGLAQSTAQHIHHWEFTEYHGGNIWQAVTYQPSAEKSWIYLTGVRDGVSEYLYVNGELAMDTYRVLGTGSGQPPRDTTDDFSIGAFLRPISDWSQGYAYFKGIIDEVNVSNVPRSAQWIKLSYMNQKEHDALVQW